MHSPQFFKKYHNSKRAHINFFTQDDVQLRNILYIYTWLRTVQHSMAFTICPQHFAWRGKAYLMTV